MSNAAPSNSSAGTANIDYSKIVRYSLPTLLEELRLERTTGAFAMEKLQQQDIGKLFQNQPKRRRAKSKQS